MESVLLTVHPSGASTVILSAAMFTPVVTETV